MSTKTFASRCIAFSRLCLFHPIKCAMVLRFFRLRRFSSQWSHNFLLSCVYKTIASSKWEFQKAIQASHSSPQNLVRRLWAWLLLCVYKNRNKIRWLPRFWMSPTTPKYFFFKWFSPISNGFPLLAHNTEFPALWYLLLTFLSCRNICKTYLWNLIKCCNILKRLPN